MINEIFKLFNLPKRNSILHLISPSYNKFIQMVWFEFIFDFHPEVLIFFKWKLLIPCLRNFLNILIILR